MAYNAEGSVGNVEAGRYMTLGTAVVILLILAAIVSNLRDPGGSLRSSSRPQPP